MSEDLGTQSFIPIILGGNLGAYSIARSFYEAYGITTLVVCTTLTGPIAHSQFIKTMVEPKMMQSKVLSKSLEDIESEYPNTELILLGSDDPHVELIVNHKKEFPTRLIIPYVDQEKFYRATNKASFYEICEKTGIPYPKTLVINDYQKDLPFNFPIIIKPANSAKYSTIEFPGREKVFICENQEDYKQIIENMQKNGYDEEIILQEYIPGDDSSMGVVTVYSSHRTGEVKLVSFGQTLLEDHTPSAIGNHLAILTKKDNQIIEDVKKLTKAMKWTGFSNYDVKYDERDHTYKFFELNARLGRSNYYVTAAGKNTAVYYVQDFIHEQPIDSSITNQQILYSVVPKKLLLDNLQSQETKKVVKKLYQRKKVYHPLKGEDETSLKRKLYIFLSKINYFRKFKKYPQPQQDDSAGSY